MNVLNNYFSVGIDAHIALQFHRARNNNPDHFKSRTRNLLYYGLEGGKDLFRQQWRNLMDFVRIECDGIDYTHRLKAYGTHSVLFLNIKSYAGGTRPWNNKTKGFGVQDLNDGLLEVSTYLTLLYLCIIGILCNIVYILISFIWIILGGSNRQPRFGDFACRRKWCKRLPMQNGNHNNNQSCPHAGRWRTLSNEALYYKNWFRGQFVSTTGQNACSKQNSDM